MAATGCIQQSESPIGDALPRAEDVRVKLPDNAAMQQLDQLAGEGISATSLAALGDVAEYYMVTRQVTRDLNGAVGWVLLVVHTIVQYPPTTIEGDTYTWGPHSDALDPSEWMLVVTEDATGERFDWQFRGRDKTTAGAELVTVISGVAYPGDEPHRGHGSFLLDFDAAEIANPVDNDERGTVEVVYDLENRDGSAASVDMIINGYDDNDEPATIEYTYNELQDTSGDFRFAIHGNLGQTALNEDAEITSTWLVTGAGRADVSITGGDLGATEVSATECWDTSFRRVFYADSNEWQPAEGSEADCAM